VLGQLEEFPADQKYRRVLHPFMGRALRFPRLPEENPELDSSVEEAGRREGESAGDTKNLRLRESNKWPGKGR
jgi:hypothetical protein